MLPELGDPLAAVTADGGEVKVWRPRRAVVVTRVTGRMTIEHAEAIIRVVDDALRVAPKQVVAIHDWCDIESYEVAVHARMSTWTLGVIGSMKRTVIGVESPLVAFAVRTVNLAVGNRFEIVRTSDEIRSLLRVALG